MKISTFLVQLDIALNSGETDNFDKMLSDLREEGLEMLDLYSDFPSKHKPEELLPFINSLGIGVSSLYHLFNFDFERENILNSIKDDTKKKLELCAYMGADVFMPVPVTDKPFADDAERGERAKIVSEYLNDVCALAKPYKITAVVENFSNMRCPFATLTDIDNLLSNNPELYYTLDTGNFWFNDIDAPEAANRYKAKIKHVHFKDITPTDNGSVSVNGHACESLELGSGIIDFPEITNTLKKAGYDKSVSIEINTCKNLLNNTKKSIGYLKKYIS